MEKDFEKWLRQDDLFEYYQDNPDQRERILNDYLREKEQISKEKINEFVKWLVNNPEEAKNLYPYHYKKLTEKIEQNPPFETANIIQEIPKHFGVWKNEVKQLYGITRKRKIKEIIYLLHFVLNKYPRINEIENRAIERTEAELKEQLKYWENELLKPEQAQPKKEKQYKSYYRAVAIYFKMKFDYEGKKAPEGKQNIWELVKNWKQPNGKKINQNEFYKMFSVGKEPIDNQSYNKLQIDFPKDYNYALTIFKERHGTTFNPENYIK